MIKSLHMYMERIDKLQNTNNHIYTYPIARQFRIPNFLNGTLCVKYI